MPFHRNSQMCYFRTISATVVSTSQTRARTCKFSLLSCGISGDRRSFCDFIRALSELSKCFIHVSRYIYIYIGNAQYFSRSYNNSSSGVNLTAYGGVIFRGVILTPKRSLKNSFSGVKMTPNLEFNQEFKVTP